MTNLLITDEIDYLYQSVFQCYESKTGYDGAWQIAPFQCSIPYEDSAIERLISLREYLRENFPELIEFGEKRALKAFSNRKSTITKPSYVSRIENYIHGQHNQENNMLNISSNEPASGGLVFSVFSPQDLIDRKRPGYVPCLISGSFLLHNDELHLNAFFRSQSVVEFGIFDLIFLRDFQTNFFKSYSNSIPIKRNVRIGPLNLLIGRVLVHRRFLKRNKSFISRADIVPDWLRTIETFIYRERNHS